MKKQKLLSAALAVLAVMVLVAQPVRADETEVETCPVIELKLLPQPAPPPPPPNPEIEIMHFEHDRKDVELLARLLWSSPLRSESSKRTLLWVVLNRVDDSSDKFGDTIAEVVNKTEFSFFDRKAHLSDTNVRLAEEILDAWKSEAQGCFVGWHVSSAGLYIRFVGEQNRKIEVTAVPGGEALHW